MKKGDTSSALGMRAHPRAGQVETTPASYKPVQLPRLEESAQHMKSEFPTVPPVSGAELIMKKGGYHPATGDQLAFEKAKEKVFQQHKVQEKEIRLHDSGGDYEKMQPPLTIVEGDKGHHAEKKDKSHRIVTEGTKNSPPLTHEERELMKTSMKPRGIAGGKAKLPAEREKAIGGGSAVEVQKKSPTKQKAQLLGSVGEKPTHLESGIKESVGRHGTVGDIGMKQPSSVQQQVQPTETSPTSFTELHQQAVEEKKAKGSGFDVGQIEQQQQQQKPGVVGVGGGAGAGAGTGIGGEPLKQVMKHGKLKTVRPEGAIDKDEETTSEDTSENEEEITVHSTHGRGRRSERQKDKATLKRVERAKLKGKELKPEEHKLAGMMKKLHITDCRSEHDIMAVMWNSYQPDDNGQLTIHRLRDFLADLGIPEKDLDQSVADLQKRFGLNEKLQDFDHFLKWFRDHGSKLLGKNLGCLWFLNEIRHYYNQHEPLIELPVNVDTVSSCLLGMKVHAAPNMHMARERAQNFFNRVHWKSNGNYGLVELMQHIAEDKRSMLCLMPELPRPLSPETGTIFKS